MSKMLTRTIYGAKLQTALLLDLDYELLNNTTLNEKFGWLAESTPQQTPRIRYLCIGNGGHRVATGPDGDVYIAPKQHRSTDASLFNFMPFKMCLPEDDTEQNRNKYRLRRIINVNNIDYVAYYLKVLNTENISPEVQKTIVDDGVENTVAWTPEDVLGVIQESGSLDKSVHEGPDAPEIDSDGVVVSSNDYLSVTATLENNFTQEDIDELINVASILYDGNELRAVISEIGICSGEDKSDVTLDGNATGTYTDAIGIQITLHITAHYPAAFTKDGFDFRVELGATEPLLGDSTVESD